MESEKLVRANETAMMFAADADAVADRAIFCRNLGWLLSQTREGVKGCHYEKDGEQEWCVVEFRHGDDMRVNIRMDSYMAIIRDVSKRI